MLPSDFGLDDYQLSNLFDDVILIEYCDLHGGEDGSEYILRGGIAVPINQVHNAWRKGKVILNGPRVQYAKVGDVVVFPNNMGIPITNLEVEGYGKIKNGLFINEQRMFGICKVNDKANNK
jgi:cellobiose-specific phosphotransferase system component IIB